MGKGSNPLCSPTKTAEEDEDQDVDVEDTNVKKGKWSTVNRWHSLPKASIIESPNDTYALRERDAGCFSSLDAEDNTTADADYIPSYRQKRMLEKKKEYMNIPQMSRSEILRQTTSTATRHGISATAHLAMVADTLSAGGADMDNFVGSVSTVKRHRLAEREAAATSLHCCIIYLHNVTHSSIQA